MRRRSHLLLSKVIYTLLIIFIYLLGKGLPLYMIDVSAYINRQIDTEALLVQTISGDIHKCSLFALGISPYMISSMFVYITTALKSADAKKRLSPTKMNKLTLVLTLVIAFFMAISTVQQLQFRVAGNALIVAKIVAVVEMIAGAMMILYLSVRNKKWGIGGQSALIFVNIV